MMKDIFCAALILMGYKIGYTQKIEGVKSYKIGRYTSPHPVDRDTSSAAKYGYKYLSEYNGVHTVNIEDEDISHDIITLWFHNDTLFKIEIPFPNETFIDAVELKYGRAPNSRLVGSLRNSVWTNRAIRASYLIDGDFRDFEISDTLVEKVILREEKSRKEKAAKQLSNKL